MAKRKLNEANIPEEIVDRKDVLQFTFDNLDLDPRILQGIRKEKFSAPTSIQAQAIPLALEGKDILARSKTGSGKTAAYLIPILQAILKRKASPSYTQCLSALILVPTRELAAQVTKMAESLSTFCGQDIRAENLARKEDDRVQKARLASNPDIVIATPGRASANLNSSTLSLKDLTQLVIDEADLVLSYGYEEDLESIAKTVPKGVQHFFMSATLRTDLETLKGLFCRDPVLLELDEEEKEDEGKVNQYVVKCAEEEKFLLIYAIFMLKLIKGKCIVFVGDIDRCYRVKLFLEQFGIRSCVLNSELPVNSRLHIVEEFNKNVYDIIIATDENEVLGDEGKKQKRRKTDEAEDDEAEEDESKDNKKVNEKNGTVQEEEEEEADATKNLVSQGDGEERPKKKRRGPKQDKEYGVARGIDFQNVACVINFDLPVSSKSYTHRIGRTARAGKTGIALSFVIPKELYRKHKPTTFPSCEHDEEALAKITKQQDKKGHKIEPYQFDMKRLDVFRYRLGDALRAVTRIAVREARTREIRQELIKSEKLKRHFEENPTDLAHLRHDGELRPARVQPHLKHVPEYLLPGGAKSALAQQNIGYVGLSKNSENRIRKARMHNKARSKGRQPAGRKADPLKTFNAKGRK